MKAADQSVPSTGFSLRRSIFRVAIHGFMNAYSLLLRAATRFGPEKRANATGNGLEILLTGTFYSDNWINAHIRPIALSGRVARVRMVAATPVPACAKVEGVYPPSWLVVSIGSTSARLATFFWVGLRSRPDFVGGFHLLLNGLVAGLLGKLCGARSLYFCVGGPRETLDGGVHGENRMFSRLETPDPWVERKLIGAVSAFDLVITMGSGAIAYFRSKGADTCYRIVPGGMDEIPPVPETKDIDLVLVARISSVKRVDLFLEAVRLVKNRFPGIVAAVIGDGLLLGECRSLAECLDISDNVLFPGHQDDVAFWLRRSRIFVLTSDSEGLSLALMEAMTFGIPAVVSNVGDLKDLVENGVNGHLVGDRTARGFADPIIELMSDEVSRKRFAAAASKSSERYRTRNTVALWDDIFDSCSSQSGLNNRMETGI